MTEQQAKALLQAYTAPDEDEGLCRLRVGKLVDGGADAFVFVCWPYSDESPIDPLFAFEYHVDRKTGEITGADAPLIDLMSGKVSPQEYGY